jgi:hypothetical protein
MLHALYLWCAAHPEATLAAVTAVLIAAWKAVPAPARAALELRYPRAVNLVRAAYALGPDVLKAAAALKGAARAQPKTDATMPPVLAPTRETRVPPPLLALVALSLAVATLPGCPWRNAEPDCTTPGAWACEGNRPHRCMSNRVLRPTRPTCGEGERCALTGGLFGAAIAACVPATDAATPTIDAARGDQ